MTTAQTRANVPTLAALGIVAYVTETMAHEAVGHGTLCVVDGGRIKLISQLYMQCTANALDMVAAGPAANFTLALLAFAVMSVSRKPGGNFQFFLWLLFAFNWLVAAGYLLVGTLSGFGDWSRLLPPEPDWIMRTAIAAFAVLAYWAGLGVLQQTYARMAGPGALSGQDLTRAVLVPTFAAGVVALAAQLYGGDTQVLSLILIFGCTFFVGCTLLMIERRAEHPGSSGLNVTFSPPWIAAAIAVAAAFILFIGPGLDLSGL